MSRVPKSGGGGGHGSLDGAVIAAVLPFVPPWAGWILLPLVPFLLRRWAAPSITAMMAAAACVTLAAVGLAAFAAHLFRARGLSVRIHAVVTMAVAGGWVLVALMLGARTPSPALWAVGFLVPITWSMRRVARAMGDAEGGDGWGELAKKARLPGSRVLSVRQDGDQITAKVRVAAGEQTGADVAAAVPNIASVLGAPPAGVRAVPSRTRADEAELTVVMRDVLASAPLWPGLSAPGRSITEPIVIGVYDTGAPLQLWLPGDPKVERVSTHILWAGMTGTGKSHGARLFLAEALSRIDCEVWVFDTVKGRQTFGPMVGLFDRLVLEQDAARKAIKALGPLLKERTDYLADRGLDQWVPGCGLAYLLVHVEEAAALLANSSAFIPLAQQARSAGITLSVSLQRTTSTNLPTDVRAQIANRCCFGLMKGDATYALSDVTLDAGADPEAWGATRPGALYAEVLGVPTEQWPTPARTFKARTDDLAAALAGRRPAAATPPAASPAVAPTSEEDVDELDELADELVDELADLDDLDDDDTTSGLPTPESPEPDIAVDPEQDIPADDDEVIPLPLPAPVAKVGREEALRQLREYLARMAEQGWERVYVGQLLEFAQSVGRSRPWLSGELAAMVKAGDLEEDPERGAYRLRARAGAGVAG